MARGPASPSIALPGDRVGQKIPVIGQIPRGGQGGPLAQRFLVLIRGHHPMAHLLIRPKTEEGRRPVILWAIVEANHFTKA
jgi:hypothetical protein